jgi:protein-L-isoaspartate O-methyltransferase
MSKMKLTVDTLDNQFKSAVINVGANSGYVEAYLTVTNLALFVYDKDGEIILERFIPIKTLQAKQGSGWTAPKFD